jgi:glycosyltransferase involved in cell wall biosynthesis
MTKPKLLFLCQTLPYPPDGGVAIRSYNILRLLAGMYDVTAMCFVRRATTPDADASLEALRSLVKEIHAYPIPQELSRGRLMLDHATALVRRRVYTTTAYESAAFRQGLEQALANTAFDLVHVDSLDLSPYLPLLAGVPTVCVHHNVESALLRRRAATESSLMRRAYLRLQSHFMENEEKRWCPRVALNVAVSAGDRRDFERLAPGSRFTVLPNGVDVAKFAPGSSDGSGIVFVGGMTWFPNKDALAYFARDILPALRAIGCQDEVVWVGRALPGAVEAYRTAGITLTGYVDDIRPYVTRAACYIVPLRVGGGTRLKILDAWAMGKAVVSTSIGCEGLDARDGWNIMIRDEPRAFAAAVHEVLSDSALQTQLGSNARQTAERVYSWDVIGETMRAEYEAVRLAKPNAGAPAAATAG